MRSVPKIFSDISKTIGASGIQFAITLFATPIMTRLYEPSAYATFGIIMSAVMSVIGIGLLSLPNAYVLEKESVARREILQTMLLLLSVLVVLSGIAAVGMAIADAWHMGIHISWIALALFPVLVLTYGMRQILTNIAVSRANFNSTAIGQVIEPACARGSAIILGALFGGNPAFILLSAIAGHMVAAFTMYRMLLKGMLLKWRVYLTQKVSPQKVLRHHSDFIFYNTLSQNTQPLVLLIIPMLLAAFFSGTDAGHYILAVSIISMPATLIAMTTSSVIYRHFIEVERTNPSKLSRHLIAAMAVYLLLGVVILLPIFFFGEAIFAFAFGKTWAAAGEIAATLSVAYMGTFVVVGVQSIFRVTRQLKLQFRVEISASTVIVMVGIYAIYTMEFHMTILCLSAVWLLRNILLLCGAVYAASTFVKKNHA